MVNSGDDARPRSRSSVARWVRTSRMDSRGTRSRTTATEAPRSEAVRSISHGTASEYRAAVVTNSHRSAAASSWTASSRFVSTTESMSGASMIARPAGTPSCGTSRSAVIRGASTSIGWIGSGASAVTRARFGRIRWDRKAPESYGWCTRTGERVVGRSTPERVTSLRTSEFVSVDLPAPVEPPMTASSGASIRRSRGSR